MKNKKIFAAMFLLAAVALLFASCAFKMDSSQSKHYEAFITGLETRAAMADVSAEEVQTMLASAKTGAAALKDTIEDKTPGKITKGTKPADLKKRFVPKAKNK